MTILTKQQQREARERGRWAAVNVQAAWNAQTQAQTELGRYYATLEQEHEIALDTLDLADRIAAWAAGQPCLAEKCVPGWKQEDLRALIAARAMKPCGTCGPCLARQWVEERGE